jgi:hypothetical protein
MTCYHCGGDHSSEGCPGYTLQSIEKSSQQIGQHVSSIARLQTSELAEISNVSDQLRRMADQDDAWVSLNEDMLDRLDGQSDRMIDAVGQSSQDIVFAIEDAADRTEHAIDRAAALNVAGFVGLGMVSVAGFVGLGALIKSGSNQIETAIASASALLHQDILDVNDSLVGLGELIEFREQMDAARHGEAMALHEDASQAGSARRNMQSARAQLFINPDEALFRAAKAVDDFPSTADTYQLRGICESVLSDHAAAARSFETALSHAKCGRAHSSLFGQGSDQKKMDRLKTALSVQLGFELLQTKCPTDAIKSVQHWAPSYDTNPAALLSVIKFDAFNTSWTQDVGQNIAELVRLSPKHFSLLFADTQIPLSRLSEVREKLRELETSLTAELERLLHFVDTKTHGTSPLLTSDPPKGRKGWSYKAKAKRLRLVKQAVSDLQG